ncbi:MAG: 3-hydroxybutyryl-CoA dehydrogenase [Fimbriimonadaceae bacterium]|nr:3-hydroxybutyryl-CoA dehydrogenase [Alphaproteobacteria bacterium]
MTRVAAIGAGRMGRGIAQVFAYAGYPVTIIDLKAREEHARGELFRNALNEIRENLQFIANEGVFQLAEIPAILDRINMVGLDDAGTAIGKCDVIFEGVPETVSAKNEALKFVSAHCGPETIIASTTSTILVDTLADFVTYPERFINAHWLNPAYLVPLVEVSPGRHTSTETTSRLKILLEKIGKVPVICSASPGYIVPRIQSLVMNEAARMVEEGVASAEDIDKAVRVGMGLRFATMGPIEFIDWGGGDILYHASRYLTGALQSDRFKAPDIIDRNMANGHIGMGAGRGFYDFEAMDVDEYRRDMLSRFVGQLRHLGLLRRPNDVKPDVGEETSIDNETDIAV